MGSWWEACRIVRKACDTEDITTLDEGIATCPPEDVEALYRYICGEAVGQNAMTILRTLVGRGLSVIPTDTRTPVGASKETLDFLLAHGWDINMRPCTVNNHEPFMWHVVSDIDMVKWCLAHGASVYLRDHVPLGDSAEITLDQRSTCQVLERVAERGTVETFELLHSKGAPVGWRSLHLAVEAAAVHFDMLSLRTHDEDPQPTADTKHLNEKTERMNMVRHLIDVVRCDVNAPDQPVGTRRFGGRRGTPICYILAASSGCDTRELTWLLLDRGADPTPALKLAANFPVCDPPAPPRFMDEVRAWKARNGEESKCCIQ